MDAFVVEERLDFLGNAHVVTQVQTANVGRRDDAIARQLPYVELMYSQYSFHLHTETQVSTPLLASGHITYMHTDIGRRPKSNVNEWLYFSTKTLVLNQTSV